MDKTCEVGLKQMLVASKQTVGVQVSSPLFMWRAARNGGEQMAGECNGVARALPVVRINGVAYFLDVRLRQLRAVDNPHDWVDFE